MSEPNSSRAQKGLGDACRRADASEIARCLRAGADPNRVVRCWGPVHALIQENPHGRRADDEPARRECLRLLIDAGADLSLRAGYPPAPPLVLAGLGGRRRLAELLIERGALVDDFANAALLRRRALEERLAQEPELAAARDASGLTVLHAACGSRMARHGASAAEDQVALVRFLIACGADVRAIAEVNVLGAARLAPSYFAISAARLEVARILLEADADATDALVTAMWNTDAEFARFGELCLKHGAEPDRAQHDGKPLLNQLVRWGRLRPAAWLLEQGADPNLADARGWTAVHQAASRGNQRFWDRIRTRGADVARRAADGTTPAELAREKRLSSL